MTIVLVDNPLHVRVKIENVTRRAFGQDDDGTPIIWAAGKAGWYEIIPSDRYLSHYNDSVEAIDLFYFMVDQHKRLSRKRQRLGFMIDPFLTRYQKHTDYRIDGDDEAMETIHKHHKFLLQQMVAEREGIDWSQTHLWQHLAETYADELDSLKASLTPSPVIDSSESDTSDSTEETSESEDDESEQKTAIPDDQSDADSTEASGNSKQSDSASSSTSEGTSDSESEVEPEPVDWTKPIWDMLNILRKSAKFDMRECGVEQAALELHKLPIFNGSHKDAIAAFERSAEPLLRLMHEARLKKKFNWSSRRIYDELEATLADEVAKDIMRTPAGKNNKQQQKHRMKSVLRPSGAHKAHKRARGAPDSLDEDDEMSDVPISSTFARRQGLQPRSKLRESENDSVSSREDSPSRQLNGLLGMNGLPSLSAGPEAQEMIDLVSQEAKRVGRQHQTSHLQAFLGQWVV